MLAGSVAMAFGTTWNVQIAGRLVTGVGGVILSVQLTKMLTDWFAGKEIATAMAILVNSWPAGIAVSLLTLPLIGTSSASAPCISPSRPLSPSASCCLRCSIGRRRCSGCRNGGSETSIAAPPSPCRWPA